MDEYKINYQFTTNVKHRERWGVVDSVRIMNGSARNMYRLVCDTQEKHIRKGLIQLGWLPPKRIGYWRRLWEVAKWSKRERREKGI